MKSLSRTRPLELPKLEQREVWAIKALYKGEASKDQQILAIETILKKFCYLGGITLDTDSAAMCAMEGKRIAATQILYIITEPFDKLFKTKKETKPDV